MGQAVPWIWLSWFVESSLFRRAAFLDCIVLFSNFEESWLSNFLLVNPRLDAHFWLAKSILGEQRLRLAVDFIWGHPNWKITLVEEYLSASRNLNRSKGFLSASQFATPMCNQLGFQHSWSGYKFCQVWVPVLSTFEKIPWHSFEMGTN